MGEILRLPVDAPLPWEAAVVCVGNFDGLHRGHRAIVERALARAASDGLPAAALTFEPHPVKFLRPDKPQTMIFPYAERYRQLLAVGMRHVVVQRFDRTTATTDAADWVRATLVGALKARHIVVGFDFRFGAAAAGDAEMLVRTAEARGVGVEVVAEIDNGGLKVSSSRIRKAIGAGNVEAADHLLGRPFSIRGAVVEGRRRGRTLGFPTINLRTDWELWPAIGVYAGIATVNGRDYAAGISVGRKTTFGGDEELTIEAHLDGFDADVYGASVALHFLARIRDQETFATAEALVEKMREDMRVAVEVFQAFSGGLDR